jgi:hypothetical protein
MRASPHAGWELGPGTGTHHPSSNTRKRPGHTYASIYMDHVRTQNSPLLDGLYIRNERRRRWLLSISTYMQAEHAHCVNGCFWPRQHPSLLLRAQIEQIVGSHSSPTFKFGILDHTPHVSNIYLYSIPKVCTYYKASRRCHVWPVVEPFCYMSQSCSLCKSV